ncbi:hypothetical protein [Streptomyces roseolus]|uniref:hypothetical protein n=1 Tax=Streptomyces roseolus TaxID=67358 RepID=UPI00364F7005
MKAVSRPGADGSEPYSVWTGRTDGKGLSRLVSGHTGDDAVYADTDGTTVALRSVPLRRSCPFVPAGRASGRRCRPAEEVHVEARPRPPSATFRPTRPASRGLKILAFVLGGLVWAVAGVLGVVLLEGSYILRHLLIVTVVSWLVFAVALGFGIAMRRREEHHASD